MAERFLLLTGATGKVGQQFLRLLFDSPSHRDFRVRALCHNRLLEPSERMEVVKGSISCRETVSKAFAGVT
ncbi:MAG: NAD(P)-dependent oxidoreductase, partial [Verrucomicrobiota bacterium]